MHDRGTQPHDGQERLPVRERHAIAVQADAQPHGVGQCVRVRRREPDGGCAVADVAQPGAQSARRQRIPHLRETGVLRHGAASGLHGGVTVRVRLGKVREHSVHAKSGQCQNIRRLTHGTFQLRRTVCCQPDAVHAGVQRDVRPDAHPGGAGGVRHPAGVVGGYQRRRQPMCRQQCGVGGGCIAEDQDGSVRAVLLQHLPQGDRFLYAGDRKGAAPRLRECLCADADAVPVCVRLDHGDGSQLLPGGSLCPVRQQAVIVCQSRRINRGVHARRCQIRPEQFMQAVSMRVIHWSWLLLPRVNRRGLSAFSIPHPGLFCNIRRHKFHAGGIYFFDACRPAVQEPLRGIALLVACLLFC